jgi:hypothetical protein
MGRNGLWEGEIGKEKKRDERKGIEIKEILGIWEE